MSRRSRTSSLRRLSHHSHLWTLAPQLHHHSSASRSVCVTAHLVCVRAHLHQRLYLIESRAARCRAHPPQHSLLDQVIHWQRVTRHRSTEQREAGRTRSTECWDAAPGRGGTRCPARRVSRASLRAAVPLTLLLVLTTCLAATSAMSVLLMRACVISGGASMSATAGERERGKSKRDTGDSLRTPSSPPAISARSTFSASARGFCAQRQPSHCQASARGHAPGLRRGTRAAACR
jgi:hypothetical protein